MSVHRPGRVFVCFEGFRPALGSGPDANVFLLPFFDRRITSYTLDSSIMRYHGQIKIQRAEY